MSINVKEVFDAFEAGKAAYEELPEARRRIDELQAQVTRMTKDGDELATKLSEVERAKAETEAKLQATMEERDQYYFRSEELAEAVAKASSLFGSVAPKTEPESAVAEASHPQSHPQSQAEGQSDRPLANEVPTSITTGKGQEQSATSPLAGGLGDTAIGGSETASTTIATTTSVASQQPMPEATESTTTSHSDGDQSAARPTPSSQFGNPQPDSTASSQDGSTPSSAIASESHASTETNVHTLTPSQQGNTITEKRYDNEPSWLKPHDMTWEQWKALGGNVPSWMNVA